MALREAQPGEQAGQMIARIRAQSGYTDAMLRLISAEYLLDAPTDENAVDFAWDLQDRAPDLLGVDLQTFGM